MKVVCQVLGVALAAPAFGLSDEGGWVLYDAPTPVHVDRYTSRGGGGFGLSFADCGITATCTEVGASGWGESYLGSGLAAHQDAGSGWQYEAWLWKGEGQGFVRFQGMAHTNEGCIRAISGKASIALEARVDIESSVTPLISAEGKGHVCNFGPGGSLGVEAEIPGGGPTLAATTATSAVSAGPHTIVIAEKTDRGIGQACMAAFDWQVQTQARSEVFVEWKWLGGRGYARGRIPRGGNVATSLTLGGQCQ